MASDATDDVREDDHEDGADDRHGKLIPEWSLGADDQILAAGLLVLLVLIGAFAWTRLTGEDDAESEAETASTVATDVDESEPTDLETAEADSETEPTGDDATDESAPITTTLPEPLDLSANVADAVSSFAISGRAEAETAVLEGFVGNEEEFEAASAAAAAVPGILSVDNRLVILEPEVVAALESAGVVDAEASMTGTEATAIGIVGNDDERADALEAASNVDGVTAVADRLRVLEPDVQAALVDAGVSEAEASVSGTVATIRGEVADEAGRSAAVTASQGVEGVTEVVDSLTIQPQVVEELNALVELEPIQFATASAEILPASFATLDQAAEVLATDPTVMIEIQGFTDTQGPESANLALSQARADSVRDYLVSKGAAADALTAVGYGETTQFAEGADPEALAENRRVRFLEL